MQQYTGFSMFYDYFMSDIPYDEWAEYVHMLLKEYGVRDGIICELGCGTGEMTARLDKKGYEVIGIDSSEDMLSVALDKQSEAGTDILYLNQDMREFELYGTVAAFVGVCDSMNYILSPEELVQVFRLVNNYLDKDGIFVFDLKTEYFYNKVLGNSVFADNSEDCSLIWENEYDPEKKLNSYVLTIYNKLEEEDGLYERIEEEHFQRAYSLEEIKQLVEKAGMEFVTAYDAFTKEAPKETSERIYIVAREKYQKGKNYDGLYSESDCG